VFINNNPYYELAKKLIKNEVKLKPLSHQSDVLTAFPQRFKKLQNAEVRAVQTPATLCKRCAIA